MHSTSNVHCMCMLHFQLTYVYIPSLTNTKFGLSASNVVLPGTRTVQILDVENADYVHTMRNMMHTSLHTHIY